MILQPWESLAVAGGGIHTSEAGYLRNSAFVPFGFCEPCILLTTQTLISFTHSGHLGRPPTQVALGVWKRRACRYAWNFCGLTPLILI